jgi:predicted membrane chloride channel (bestrophin family)
MVNAKRNHLWQKWHILFKVLPLLFVVFLLKLLFHRFGFEYISLNALFTSLIASTTFLIGFLITGVISDYKESEKLPGELASSMESLYDEAQILEKTKGTKSTREFIRFYKDYVHAVDGWFGKKERTRAIMGKLSEMNGYFAKFEPLTQATFIAKMKNEQNTQRKIITRIHTIRETSFVQSAYAILEVLGFFVISGLLILKVEPFYEAVFFTVIVSFLIMYMVFLIKDLDNPFEYERYGETGTEVSLKPLHDFISRLE